MAIGVIWYPPIDQETYDAISEKVIGQATENGLQLHAAGEGDGAWRIIEVWESREGLQRFRQEHLNPAVDEVSGGQAPTPEPEVVFDIHNQGP
jgi:quinol monooxygenase YgiN